ncbi:hypothetical protein [Actinomadura sp. 3N407]|uniref:hypothetical protein n=1 Tax=Actinomadura sp. 3N407 TaxID=3457423 RepID=UPI003FCDC6E7
MLAAAAMALSLGCSSSSDGEVICAPCRPPVMVTVTGLDRFAGDGWSMRMCVGELPCTEFRVPRRAGSGSCGPLACFLDEKGALQVTLQQRDARTVADLPVRVTAHGTDALRGSGTMTYVPDKGPCRCDYSYARVALT